MLTQPVSQENSIEIEMIEEAIEEEIAITEVITIGEVVIENVITARNKRAEAGAEAEVEIRREDKRIEEVHHLLQTAVDCLTTLIQNNIMNIKPIPSSLVHVKIITVFRDRNKIY